MTTMKLTKKMNLLPQESCKKVENLVERLSQLNAQSKKEAAFKVFMEKMTAAEKLVEENGYYSEEEAEEELAKI